ncbi:AMIN-like domain-containing (lipo)protein [Aestuariimicrobium soli]|uniref:AMIN-like domain-containing (lipo)protein n=1 Tax=Aestuariimicrobium soli TaxID=2035834 RepID=UPI003EB6B12A
MFRSTLRRSAAALALGLAVTGAPVALGATSANAAPYCGITWGSLAKSSQTMTASTVLGLRTGRHACYDRLVVDIKGKVTGYDVRYVSQVTMDGSGLPVAVAGGAKLQVVVRAAAWSRPAMPSVAGYTTFRQVAWAGSFEGQTTFGLGVRARLPHRVFTLYDASTNTTRIVVDVAHQW